MGCGGIGGNYALVVIVVVVVVEDEIDFEPRTDAAAAELSAEQLRFLGEAALLAHRDAGLDGRGAAPQRERLERTLRWVQGHLEAHPDAPVSLVATALRLRVRLEGAGLVEEARALSSANADDAESAWARWALAEALYANGDLPDASPILAELTTTGPEVLRARVAYELATASLVGEQHQAAREAAEAALALAPEWRAPQLVLLDLRLSAGEYQAVREELEALGPPAGEGLDPERQLRLVRALLALEEVDAADHLWLALPEEVRSRDDVRPLGAVYYLSREEPFRAIDAVRALAADDHAHADFITLYADALSQAGRTLEASAQYERAIALDPAHPEALIGFSAVLYRARKYREAKINLDRAEAGLRGRLRPPAVLARLQVMRARVMVEERELTQAATLLRRTVAVEGAPSEGWFYLGEALSRSNSPEARQAYERYLELHPTGPLAVRARRAIR